MKNNFVLRFGYGTNRVRSIIVNAANGLELASCTFYYPHWKR